MQQTHINKFWSCFPGPPSQSAVGISPQKYLDELNRICGLNLAWPNAHPTGKLTRIQLRNLCRDSKVDVLIAYAGVMAWGGRNFKNFRLSLNEPSRSNLVEILKYLSASKANRQYDFAKMQQDAKDITGLGISFYTKLLFFFRKNDDAYILDQFTAKSAMILFDSCEITLNSDGYPKPNIDPNVYEWFCCSIELLGNQHTTSPWTGKQIEQAMFDVRNGLWRKYLRSIYGKTGVKKTKTRELTLGVGLPDLVVQTHAAAYTAGIILPGENPIVGLATPIRVHCSSLNGISWQYAFSKKSIHAEVFISEKHIDRYDALRRSLNLKDHNFGDNIHGNGAKMGKTRSIKLIIPHGLDAPQSQWDQIAKLVVSAMDTLYNRFHEII